MTNVKIREGVPPNNQTRDHYLPQLLLEQFVGPRGLVSAYDKDTGRSFSAKPVNHAFIGKWDRFADGNSTYWVDYNAAEGPFARVLKRLVEGVISPDDYPIINRFVAHQVGRSPEQARRLLKIAQEDLANLEDACISTDAMSRIRDEHNSHLDGRHDAFRNKVGHELALGLIEAWRPRLWTLISPRSSSFHIGDSPVSSHFTHYELQNQNPYRNPYSIITMPVSPKYILIGVDPRLFPYILGISGRIKEPFYLNRITPAQMVTSLVMNRTIYIGTPYRKAYYLSAACTDTSSIYNHSGGVVAHYNSLQHLTAARFVYFRRSSVFYGALNTEGLMIEVDGWRRAWDPRPGAITRIRQTVAHLYGPQHVLPLTR